MDAPYEHNAGDPYTWHEHDAERGIQPYSVMKVAFEVELEQPNAWVENSGYSVEDINIRKAVPWLQSGQYGKPGFQIWAGTTIREFRNAIKGAGGGIWEPASLQARLIGGAVLLLALSLCGVADPLWCVAGNAALLATSFWIAAKGKR